MTKFNLQAADERDTLDPGKHVLTFIKGLVDDTEVLTLDELQELRDVIGEYISWVGGAGKLRMAKVLRVEQRIGRPGALYIDGERFPYYTLDGLHIAVRMNNQPGVTLTIAAEKVEAELGEVLP